MIFFLYFYFKNYENKKFLVLLWVIFYQIKLFFTKLKLFTKL